jgi:hypothetical protein
MAKRTRKSRGRPRNWRTAGTVTGRWSSKPKEGEAADVAPTADAPPAPNMRQHVLRQADLAVNGSRQIAYGAPENNFARIKDLWNTYLECRPPGHRGEIVETDVAVMNILLKIGRLAGNPGHIDSWIDIAGYAACGAEVASVP